MRSFNLCGFFLLYLLDFWRPAETLCSLNNGTFARCHYLEDVRFVDTYQLQSLKASVKHKILTSDAFQNLFSLRHLDLSGGHLEEIHPGTFLGLPDLLSLNLAENHIKNLNSSSLEGLMNLQNLNLRSNSIHNLPQTVLYLKNLKVLDISGNPVECNCETLRARDKLVEKGVKISKRTLCTGPIALKGWSLLKPSSKLICISQDLDEGMQMDQPIVEDNGGSGELGSGDEELFENEDKEDDLNEDVDISPEFSENAETPAPETPAPVKSEAEIPVPEIPLEPTKQAPTVEESVTSVSPVEVSLEKTKLKGDDGLFFDRDEKPSSEISPVLQTERITENYDLVSSVEGSGDDDEFEGSGTRVPPIDFGKLEVKTVFDNTEAEAHEGSLFDDLFGSWSDGSSTASPKTITESDIIKEEFMPVVPQKVSEVEEIKPKNGPRVSYESSLDLLNKKDVNGTKNLETEQEIADASSQDTKIGNGSMVVLVVLLAIFVALVGLAAYKGDFCKKKRVPDDLERGTELKEMRKSLLDGGNVQAKAATNGNTETAPLMNAAPLQEAKDSKPMQTNENFPVDESAKSEPSAPESLDPVKPPRKSIPHEELLRPSTNGKSNPESCNNPELKFRNIPLNSSLNDVKTPSNTPVTPMDFGSPPLSPDAQRVKIILQDNPDSVPKTPILITRTKIGENLVKTQ